MQNSKLKKEILGQHKEVSAKELELYRAGKLSADKAREVEMKLHSNEFSAVAAEGFDTYGGGMSASEIGHSYRYKNYRSLYLSALVIALLTTVGFYIFKTDNPAVSETISNPEIKESLNPNQTKILEQATNTEQISIPKTANNQSSVKTQVTPNINPVSERQESEVAKLANDLPVLFSTEMEREIFKPTPIETKRANLDPSEEVIKPVSKQVNLRHYKNYKLVDQGFGIDQSRLTPILQGTPAFSEIVYQRPEYPEWLSADSVYQLTINKAIDFIIDEKLSEAQFHLEKLVELEESDITATFYLGYVYFLRENYKQAIVYFNRTETHIIQTFDHDARFMEIKCLLALNNKEEAKKEVDFLVSSKSFYAEKAKELIAP